MISTCSSVTYKKSTRALSHTSKIIIDSHPSLKITIILRRTVRKIIIQVNEFARSMTIRFRNFYTRTTGFTEITCPFEHFVVKSYLRRGQAVMNHCRFERHDMLASWGTKVHEDTAPSALLISRPFNPLRPVSTDINSYSMSFALKQYAMQRLNQLCIWNTVHHRCFDRQTFA